MKIQYAILSLIVVLAIVAIPAFAATDQTATTTQTDSTGSIAQTSNGNQENSPDSSNIVINSVDGNNIVLSSTTSGSDVSYVASQYVGTALPDSYYTSGSVGQTVGLGAGSQLGPDPENPGPNVGNPYTPYSEAALFPGEIVAIPVGTNLKAGERFNLSWWAGSPVAISVINDNDRSTALNSILGQENFDPVTQNITHPGLNVVPITFDSGINSGYSRINTAYVTIPADGNYDWVVNTHELQVAYQQLQYVPQPYGTIDFAFVGYQMS